MKPNLLRHFSAALFIFCYWITGAEAATHCIWFADDNAIYQVNTDTNQIAQTVAIKEVQSLAMNGSDCGVTVLARKQLSRFDGNGVLLQTTDLRALNRGLDDAEQLLIDTYDNSVWLRDEKTMVHLTANGQLIGSFITQGSVRSMVLALDESIWVLGNKQLLHYSASGTMLVSQDLKKLVNPEPKLLAIDSVGGLLWFAGEKQVVLINLNQTGQATLNMNLQSEASALALNPLTGELWVATSGRLQSYGRDGTLHNTVDLKVNHLSDVSQLAFDPVTQTLWALSDHAISRFSGQGQLQNSLPVKDDGAALAVPAFTVTPALSLKHPVPNGLTNNALTTITYGFDALCNNQSCAFAPGYFSSYNLTATLNQQSISPFVFDGTSGQSSYTPITRLPEGLNTLSAQTTDRFGHASQTANDVFTVDTIPPKFLSISPADGSVVTTPNVLLQGVVDDPTAIVVLQGAGMAMSTTVVGTTLKFSIPVQLAQGLNTFALTAMDKAGNATTAAVRITYNPVSFTVTSPINGAMMSGNTVLVSGTFTAAEQVGISINGIVATIIGNNFYANVPLQAGTNKLTTTLIAQSGLRLTQEMSITQSGTSPFSVIVSNDRGLAPLAVSFGFSSHTGTTVQSVRADFNGTGQYTDTFNIQNGGTPTTNYSQPGLYQARFEITDTTGQVSTVTTAIFVENMTVLDATLRASYSSMLQKLANKDIQGALAYVHGNSVDKYARVFHDLGDSLPLIVPQLGVLGAGRISDDIAEYMVTRNSASGPKLFLIYFSRSGDGVWRIEAM
jgi:hypothetical protein